MFGAEIFAEFAVGCGAVADAGAFLKRIKAALVETAKPQVAAQKEEEPVSRFFRFLRSAINAKRACVFAMDADGRPNRSAAWGFPDNGSTAPDQVGWANTALDELYLDPEAAYRVAASMVANGHGIGVKLSTLKKLIEAKRMLKRTGHDEGRDTPLYRETIQGVRQSVLV
jgi:hypothetical protein